MCVQWRSKRGGGSTPGTVFSFSSLGVGTFFCFLFSFCRGGQHFSWWWLKEATNSGSVSGMKSSSYPTECMSDNMIKIMMTMATTIIVKKNTIIPGIKLWNTFQTGKTRIKSTLICSYRLELRGLAVVFPVCDFLLKLASTAGFGVCSAGKYKMCTSTISWKLT